MHVFVSEFNCACYKDCTCSFKPKGKGKCFCVDDKNPVSNVCVTECVCVCVNVCACVRVCVK